MDRPDRRRGRRRNTACCCTACPSRAIEWPWASECKRCFCCCKHQDRVTQNPRYRGEPDWVTFVSRLGPTRTGVDAPHPTHESVQETFAGVKPEGEGTGQKPLRVSAPRDSSRCDVCAGPFSLSGVLFPNTNDTGLVSRQSCLFVDDHARNTAPTTPCRFPGALPLLCSRESHWGPPMTARLDLRFRAAGIDRPPRPAGAPEECYLAILGGQHTNHVKPSSD